MRALATLLLAGALAGCAPGESVLRVTLTARGTLDGIARFAVTVENGGHSGAVDYPPTEAPTLPPSHTLALGFGADREGRAVVTVEAFDGAQRSLGKAMGEVTLRPSHTDTLTITFDGANDPGDMPRGDGGDGGGGCT